MSMTGGCHCGDVTVEFETGVAAGDLVVRACQCSFCRKHGARAVSDPQGRLTVTLKGDGAATRYQFEPKTAEFVVCRTCGGYVCALLEADGASYATLNINVLDERAAFSDVDQPVSYDAETPEDRITRRINAWTPARVVVSDTG